ncbi:hypothetical protein [Taklimakanibacter albus]|uniref:Uncharacterized protein n=1 Tax=Taklimakanibacter albus TaxID=2800327 RepID=A0ACC5RBC9_9HYPH|nr:hypothetical protein [Aestuariivirga sp. YIM B02566]MBK1869986.1 hypothetical protein [Aestuariivirga sp. YIM B02566]
MNNEEIEHLLSRIKDRYAQIKHDESRRERFLLHLESLGRWENEPMDYPDVTPEFPETVYVAYAVCHPNCGTRDLIIDGGTQECQRCGSSMFRLSAKLYGIVNSPLHPEDES